MLELHIENLSKSFGTLPVLSGLTMTLTQDNVYCLMSPSGSGKTTLLRILMGLTPPDRGSVCMHDTKTGVSRPLSSLRISAVFQEDRLCPTFSPLENLSMVLGKTLKAEKLRQEMLRLLPEECLTRPVSTLSGGMKRRTAILRALLAPFDLLIMDEPFTGLDADTREEVIRYVLEKRMNRFLIAATHQPEEAALLGGHIIHL